MQRRHWRDHGLAVDVVVRSLGRLLPRRFGRHLTRNGSMRTLPWNAYTRPLQFEVLAPS